MRKYCSFAFVLLVSLTGFVSAASASFIDFRSAAFSGATGKTSYGFATADGVAATAVPGPTGATISWEAGDGLGVNYFDTAGLKDEIDGTEFLTINFAQSVRVDQILLTDLFVEGFLSYRVETGSATTNNGTTWFSASGAPNGELMLSLGQDLTSITFRAKSALGHDFSVGGLSAVRSAVLGTSVPELDPNAGMSGIALLLGSVACAFGRRRR